ncbi:MAG: hypothetical protein WEA59_04995 [Ferruginibacter sp.]
MKKIFFLCLVVLSTTTTMAQKKWVDLSKEEKLMKLQSFRDDNQKFAKEKLGMTPEQLEDIDNVNICYLSTLDRIDRYGKDDAAKDKYVKSITSARSTQLDAIMGVDKRKQYSDYVQAKIEKAIEQMD